MFPGILRLCLKGFKRISRAAGISFLNEFDFSWCFKRVARISKAPSVLFLEEFERILKSLVFYFWKCLQEPGGL